MHVGVHSEQSLDFLSKFSLNLRLHQYRAERPDVRGRCVGSHLARRCHVEPVRQWAEMRHDAAQAIVVQIAQTARSGFSRDVHGADSSQVSLELPDNRCKKPVHHLANVRAGKSTARAVTFTSRPLMTMLKPRLAAQCGKL